MNREQQLQEMARKLLPESYTDNWQEKQAIWVSEALWADENSQVGDLQDKIRDLKDELWDMEYNKDEEINELKDRIKELESIKTM